MKTMEFKLFLLAVTAVATTAAAQTEKETKLVGIGIAPVSITIHPLL